MYVGKEKSIGAFEERGWGQFPFPRVSLCACVYVRCSSTKYVHVYVIMYVCAYGYISVCN